LSDFNCPLNCYRFAFARMSFLRWLIGPSSAPPIRQHIGVACQHAGTRLVRWAGPSGFRLIEGEINDANWAKWEQEIFAAANQGRIAEALDKDGNKLSELR
jgi:hypothetical protein